MRAIAEHVDVAIVGGGPAGAAAAITLARNGAQVVLCEKAHFPRDKCCGDGLTTGALRRLEQLEVAVPELAGFTRVDTLHVRSPSGRVAKVPLSSGGRRTPPGLRAGVVRRLDLDVALITSARAAGVRVLEGQGLEAIEADGGGVAIEAGGRLIRASHVVAADGAWSTVRKMLEPGAPRHQSPADWHAYRAYAHGVSASAARELWVWFPTELLPGYAWSFPLAGGRANVGICLARGTGESGRELADRWRRFADSPLLASLLGSGATLEPVRSWPIPAALSLEGLCALDGRVLFVGDAAGAADPFSGEGIAQALETGIVAAHAISDGRASHDAAARYRAALAASLALEQRMARVCRRLMARPLGARGAVRLTGANSWTLRNVGRWLYEDFPRPLVVAPRTWRRGVLSQPPPFSSAR